MQPKSSPASCILLPSCAMIRLVKTVEDGLLTIPEVARRLRISEWTVRRWLREGRLKGFRIGGTRAGWRVREEDLEAFLESLERRDER